MSQTISDYYKFAALATASYVRMGGQPLDGATFARIAADPELSAGGRLPLSIATELFNPADPDASRWQVVHYHGGDVPGEVDTTGFAATLFERGGEKVLAIRGVEPTVTVTDAVRDLVGASVGGIGLLGVALNQLVDLVNFIQRLYGTGTVTQLRAEFAPTPGARPGAIVLPLQGVSLPSPIPGLPDTTTTAYLSLSAYEAQGANVLTPGDRITLTGHSLGGHLAIAAAQLLGNRINSDVYVYNSAGFDPASVNVIAAGASLFPFLGHFVPGLLLGAKAVLAESLGAGALLLSSNSQQASGRILVAMRSVLGTPPAAFTVHNLESEDSAPGNDQSVVASVFTGTQGLGPEKFVPVEVNSHSIEQLTDALALHAVLSKLNGNLQFADVAKLVAAASHEPAHSEERVVEALQNLLLPPQDRLKLDTSDATSGLDIWTGAGDISARNQYHTALLRLNKAIEGKAYQLDLLLDLSPTDLGNLAQGSEAIAYRYALKELNLFAVIDASGALYARFLPNGINAGELDLYDPVTRTGSLTAEWIEDRARLLHADAVRNRQDNPEIARIAGTGGNSTEYRYYAEGKERVLFADPANRTRPRSERLVAFADDAGRILVGTDNLQGDHLYGGGGNDTLQGGRGNDYLEGGNGFDTYVWNTGDGFDTILDSDGIGRLVVNGTTVSGGIRIAPGNYVGPDNLVLRFEGESASGGVLIVNGDLRVENFTTGDLGIVLNDQGNVAEIQPTFNTLVGDQGISGATDGNDLYLISPTELIAYFFARGGDDLSQPAPGQHSTNQVGDSGDDILIGGAGIVDSLWGGPGRDFLYGGEGRDYLVGDYQSAQFYRAGPVGAPDLDFNILYNAFVSGAAYGFRYTGTRDPFDFWDISIGGYYLGPTIKFSGGWEEALRYMLGIGAATDVSTLYDDVLDGGRGDDEVVGGPGSDILMGGDGNDILHGDNGGLPPVAIAESEFAPEQFATIRELLGKPGDDYLDGGDGDDRLADEDGGSDVFFGGRGIDRIVSTDPDSESTSFSNHLDGGDGNDVLAASNSSVDGFDVLIGGLGNDVLQVKFGSAYVEGGSGSDTYMVTDSGLGILSSSLPRMMVINDLDDVSDGSDRLVITLSSPISELSVTRDELNIYIGRMDDSSWIAVENWFAGPEYKIEEIVFDNATTPGLDQVFNVAAIESRFTTATAAADLLWGSRGDDQLFGGEGDDTLFGGAGADILAGNEGNDTLDGGEDGDTYVFNIGDGIDRILDAGLFGNDVVAFGPGITPDMLTLTLGSLLIKVGENGDAIHLDSFVPDDALNSETIGHFRFANGTTLSHSELLDRGFDIAGTDGNDMLVGTSVNDRFAGGRGSDTYFFGRGSGQDFIEDIDPVGLDTDSVRLGADVLPHDIVAARAGDYVTLSINDTGDQLSTRWQPEAGYRIERFEFVDGTVWDAAMLESMVVTGGGNTAPTPANAIVDQVAHEDSPFSFAIPAGTFVDSDAGDALTFSAALADGSPLPGWLSFDAAARSFSGTPTNEDVGAFDVTVTATDIGSLVTSDTFQLTVANTNDAPVLEQPLADQFANQNAPFAFPVSPGTFADVDAGDELTLTAALLEGGGLPAWLAFDPAAGTFSGTPSELDVGGIEIRVTATDRAGAAISDNFTLFISDASMVNETHVGTRRDDVIVTGIANDWIDAGGGDDWVRAGAGRDVILGGRGSDRLAGGAGNDVYIHDRQGGHDLIEEMDGADTLRLGEGITPDQVRLGRRRDDLVVDLKGADGSVTVKEWFASDAAKVETIQFADGTAWGVDEISNRVPRKRSERRRDDDPEHAHPHGGRDDDHHGKPDGRRHDDDAGSRPDRTPDRIADLLEAVLARKPRYDFEALERELDRPQRRGEELDAQEIARRWEIVRRYANGTASERDEDARGGAVHRFDEGALAVGLDFGRGGFDTGWSELARGAASLRTFKGLDEILPSLRR